ncbi:protein-tyrosine-phosphatase [Aliidongia dinghuensis]|uniref:Protein-tyrosine-phosphatase n=1 Tax=Aliidongia dinghuensis TaxID=1867774 RepID=A0A8J3E5F2_9PROT|nr:protein-tyrosine-phosphatase [Aliidongia dinghuensis]GGF21322.1 protein-tyrosine-phosphatase [Aliidongia dinghuensis]
MSLTPFEISICGIEELPPFETRGVTHLLSVLDPDFPEPECLALLSPTHRLQLRFHDAIDPRPGEILVERDHVRQVLEFGRDLPGPKGHLLVHCHAGVSRSTAFTILLLAQALPEVAAPDIVAEVVRVRSRAWPNLRIIELGDELLGRNGTLVGAVRARHAEYAKRVPRFVQLMKELGREREVDGLEL